MGVSVQLKCRSKKVRSFKSRFNPFNNKRPIQRIKRCIERMLIIWLLNSRSFICWPLILTMNRTISSPSVKIIIISLHSKYSGLVSGSAHLQYADEHPWHPCGHPAWHGHVIAQLPKSMSHWYSQRKSPKHLSFEIVFTNLILTNCSIFRFGQTLLNWDIIIK